MLLTIISVSSIYPTINIRIEPTNTIIQLKEEIKKKINIIIERQRLIFAGRLLQNEETCRLLADSTCIHLLIIDETKYWKDKIDTLITERQEAAQQETKYLKDKIERLTTNLNSESEFNQSQISNDSNTVVSTTSPIQGLPSMFREWRHSKTTW